MDFVFKMMDWKGTARRSGRSATTTSRTSPCVTSPSTAPPPPPASSRTPDAAVTSGTSPMRTLPCITAQLRSSSISFTLRSRATNLRQCDSSGSSSRTSRVMEAGVRGFSRAKTDEICAPNDVFCILNDGFCTQNAEAALLARGVTRVPW